MTKVTPHTLVVRCTAIRMFMRVAALKLFRVTGFRGAADDYPSAI